MSDDYKMSDEGYVQKGAFLTDNDGGVYEQQETGHVDIKGEYRDENGSVVEFEQDGHTYLTDGGNVVYRLP